MNHLPRLFVLLLFAARIGSTAVAGSDGRCVVSSPTIGSFWCWYKSCLSDHPLITKSLTSSIIMTTSDAICQQLECKLKEQKQHDRHQIPLDESIGSRIIGARRSMRDIPFSLDKQRSWHVAITGATMSGPISHFWYGILQRTVTVHHKGLKVAICMVLDALLFSPVAVAAYFIWRGVLEGNDFKRIANKLKESHYRATLASWRFWPLANIVNFSVIPVEFRVLYNNSLSLFWSGYLSYINGRPGQLSSD